MVQFSKFEILNRSTQKATISLSKYLKQSATVGRMVAFLFHTGHHNIAQKTNSVTCNFITENTSYMKISLFIMTIHKDFQQLLRILVNVKHKHWHYPQSWLHDKISAFWVGLFGCFVVEFQAKFPSLKQIQNLLMSMGKTLSENTWNYYIVPHSQDPYHIITLYRVWSFGNKVWNKQNYTSAEVLV